LSNQESSHDKPDISYAAYAAVVMVALLLAYAAYLGLTNPSLGAANHFLIICLMALTIAIVYVGIQVGRIAEKLR
jgi:hypothetical protein